MVKTQGNIEIGVGITTADAERKLKGLGTSLGGLDTHSVNLASKLTTLTAGLNIAEKAFGAVKQVIDKTVTVAVDYAKSVRDMGTALGISAEEASYLLQIADDLKIPVNNLEVAFRNAIKEGIQPTVENLKDLAGQYQAIKTPVERAQFAMKIFGTRAGPEMQKLLESTPAAIDAMAKSAENAGLIMSGQAAQDARDLEIALDDLEDSVNGAAIGIGLKLIPVLNDLLTLSESQMLAKMFDIDKNSMFFKIMDMDFDDKNLREYIRALKELKTETGWTSDATEAMTGRLEAQYEAWQKLHPELQEGAGEMDELGEKVWNVSEAMNEYSKRLLFNQASAGLDREASLQLMQAMGLVNDTTLIALQKSDELRKKREAGTLTLGGYIKATTDLDLAIRSLTDRHITITTTHIDEYISSGSSFDNGGSNDTYGDQGGGAYNPNPPPVVNQPSTPPPPISGGWGRDMTDFAAGGSRMVPPGYPNDTFPLGPGMMASSGEVVTISPQFNLTQQPGQSAQEFAREVMREVEKLVRAKRLSGAQYTGR